VGSAGIRYSCAGICCSTSRQALIFKRRHTQQSWSPWSRLPAEPQTVHLSVGFGLSSGRNSADGRTSAITGISNTGSAFFFGTLMTATSLCQIPKSQTTATRVVEINFSSGTYAAR
jgi:hypothetical protein